jgi:hypothetical protein
MINAMSIDNSLNVSALIEACSQCDIDQIDSLLSATTLDPNVNEGEAVLMLIESRAGDELICEGLQILCQFKLKRKFTSGPIFRLPVLHRLAEKGYIVCTKSLISKGADVNAIDYYSFTPIYYSLEHPDILEVYLNHHAQISRFKKPLLQYAFEKLQKCRNIRTPLNIIQKIEESIRLLQQYTTIDHSAKAHYLQDNLIYYTQSVDNSQSASQYRNSQSRKRTLECSNSQSPTKRAKLNVWALPDKSLNDVTTKLLSHPPVHCKPYLHARTGFYGSDPGPTEIEVSIQNQFYDEYFEELNMCREVLCTGNVTRSRADFTCFFNEYTIFIEMKRISKIIYDREVLCPQWIKATAQLTSCHLAKRFYVNDSDVTRLVRKRIYVLALIGFVTNEQLESIKREVPKRMPTNCSVHVVRMTSNVKFEEDNYS